MMRVRPTDGHVLLIRTERPLRQPCGCMSGLSHAEDGHHVEQRDVGRLADEDAVLVAC